MHEGPEDSRTTHRWSTVVRYAEVDQQGVVFNAHYLTYCDEAMNAFCHQAGLGELAAELQLVTTTVTWTAPARFGAELDVDARCTRVGRSSLAMAFVLTADGAPCCRADTVYVRTDPGTGRPVALSDAVRERLSSD